MGLVGAGRMGVVFCCGLIDAGGVPGLVPWLGGDDLS